MQTPIFGKRKKGSVYDFSCSLLKACIFYNQSKCILSSNPVNYCQSQYILLPKPVHFIIKASAFNSKSSEFNIKASQFYSLSKQVYFIIKASVLQGHKLNYENKLFVILMNSMHHPVTMAINMFSYPEALKDKPKNFFQQHHLWAVPTLDQLKHWGPVNWSTLVHDGLAAARAIRAP